uniref:Acid-sensing (Proton-gated) ion channel 1c n=1 Tax=Nothobranchius furzeri TaxID=105023 RepID=A0A8C6LX59_NOTFU
EELKRREKRKGGNEGRPSNLQAFANISTLHGMSHIFAYGHMTFRRFLWTLSFLGSLALLLLVTMDRVLYYLEYPHVTKLDEVAATNLTFPAVTFCNLNEFRFSKITKNDLYHVGELLALLNNLHQIANPHLAEPEVLAALKDKANFNKFKPSLFNMTDFYNRTGHDIDDMLLQCTFRGEDCLAVNFTTVNDATSNSKSCHHKWFVLVSTGFLLQCKDQKSPNRTFHSVVSLMNGFDMQQ